MNWPLLAACAALTVSCGARTSPTAELVESDGGSGGSGGGGGAALRACPGNGIVEGTRCTEPGVHCGGPCVNSWQADNVCNVNAWTLTKAVACGPKASSAPTCGGGPCCPFGGLECGGKPAGYPGFSCTPPDNRFCACNCIIGGQYRCEC